MQSGNLWPSNGFHLAGCVELHGATTEWNHGAIESQVTIPQGAYVSQHGGFIVV
ncbi:unannotated protein [freshwater metagenome]|uniref:Unannotated protein n=1 Tax=freshwater metagenome TaxID=449393 RepID=A0A6J7T3M1_9ZZZZ